MIAVPQPLTNGYQNHPLPARSHRATTVALSVLAATLFVLAGVFTALFLSASGDHDALAARLADQEETLASVQERVSATDAQAQAALDRMNAEYQ